MKSLGATADVSMPPPGGLGLLPDALDEATLDSLPLNFPVCFFEIR